MSAHSTGRSVERTICCVLMRDPRVRGIVSGVHFAMLDTLGIPVTEEESFDFARGIQLDLLENDVEGDCA